MDTNRILELMDAGDFAGAMQVAEDFRAEERVREAAAKARQARKVELLAAGDMPAIIAAFRAGEI